MAHKDLLLLAHHVFNLKGLPMSDQMPKREVVIVLKRAGLIVPENFLAHVLDAGFTSYTSATVATPEKFLVGTKVPESFSLDQLMSFQDAQKASQVLMAFGKHEGKLDEAEIPPYSLVGTEEEVQLAAFLFGDFSEYVKGPTDMSGMFHCMSAYLRPKINQVYELTGLNFDATKNFLRSETFITEMRKITPEGGVIFMTGDGEVVPFCTPANLLLDNEFDWGWATSLCGFSKEEKKEESAKKSVLQIKDPNWDQNKNPVMEEEVNKRLEDAKKQDKEAVYPPSTVNKNDLPQWYLDNNKGGIIPHNWHKRPPIFPRDGAPCLLEKAPAKGEKIKNFQDMGKHVETVGDTVVVKNTASTHIPKEGGPTPGHTPSAADPKQESTVPSLSQASVKSFIDFINAGKTKQVMDNHSQVLMRDPSKINEMDEKNIKSFFEETNIPIEKCFKMPYETLRAMGRLDIDLLAKLCLSYQHVLMAGYKAEDLFKLMFPEGAKTKQELPPPTPSPEPTVKQEASPEVTAPTGKPRFKIA